MTGKRPLRADLAYGGMLPYLSNCLLTATLWDVAVQLLKPTLWSTLQTFAGTLMSQFKVWNLLSGRHYWVWDGRLLLRSQFKVWNLLSGRLPAPIRNKTIPVSQFKVWNLLSGRQLNFQSAILQGIEYIVIFKMLTKCPKKQEKRHIIYSIIWPRCERFQGTLTA